MKTKKNNEDKINFVKLLLFFIYLMIFHEWDKITKILIHIIINFKSFTYNN